MKVKLSYTFIFEPAETWANKSGFDNFIAKSLRDMGLVAERVRTDLQNDNIVEEMLIIHRLEQPVEENPESKRTLAQVKDMLTKKRDESGKFTKRNE